MASLAFVLENALAKAGLEAAYYVSKTYITGVGRHEKSV